MSLSIFCLGAYLPNTGEGQGFAKVSMKKSTPLLMTESHGF